MDKRTNTFKCQVEFILMQYARIEIYPKNVSACCNLIRTSFHCQENTTHRFKFLSIDLVVHVTCDRLLGEHS